MDILEISRKLQAIDAEEKREKLMRQAELMHRCENTAENYSPEEAVGRVYGKQRMKQSLKKTLELGMRIRELFWDLEEHPVTYSDNTWYSNNLKKPTFYREIQRLLELKVLVMTSSWYSFQVNQSRRYFFSFPVFSLLLRYSDSLSIKISSPSSFSYHICLTSSEEDDSDRENQPFPENFDPSRLRIRKRMRMDVTGVPESVIRDALGKAYPQVGHYRGIVDRLNSVRPDEEKIRFGFTLKYRVKDSRKYLVKVGFRAFSPICSYKVHVNENPFYQGKWRNDYLDGRFGQGWDHYDFNASIYRLTYGLAGEYLAKWDMDVYAAMYGRPFKSAEDREAFKKICMRLMFGNEKSLGNCVERRFSKADGYNWDSVRRNSCQTEMQKAKRRMEEVLGGFCGEEIFLHESCVYIGILDRLSDSTCLVYDSFYSSDRLSANDMHRLYSDSLSFYKSSFSKSIFFTSFSSYHICLTSSEEDDSGHTSLFQINVKLAEKKRIEAEAARIAEEERKKKAIRDLHLTEYRRLLTEFKGGWLPRRALNLYEDAFGLCRTTRRSDYRDTYEGEFEDKIRKTAELVENVKEKQKNAK